MELRNGVSRSLVGDGANSENERELIASFTSWRRPVNGQR